LSIYKTKKRNHYAFNKIVEEVKNNRCPSCGGILVLRTATGSAGNRFRGETRNH